MHPTTWILVSDAAKGRLFKEVSGKIEYLTEFSHPGSAAHVSARLSSPAGRRGTGGVDRPALSAKTDPKEGESLRFAQSHARYLKRALDAHEFQSLVLVAPPHFLGMLRQTLDEQVEQRIVSSFPREFSGLEVHEVIDRLQEFLHESP